MPSGLQGQGNSMTFDNNQSTHNVQNDMTAFQPDPQNQSCARTPMK